MAEKMIRKSLYIDSDDVAAIEKIKKSIGGKNQSLAMRYALRKVAGTLKNGELPAVSKHTH